MTGFRKRCVRCRKRGLTSPVSFETYSWESKIRVEWRLCQTCFPAAARDFTEAEKTLRDSINSQSWQGVK